MRNKRRLVDSRQKHIVGQSFRIVLFIMLLIIIPNLIFEILMKSNIYKMYYYNLFIRSMISICVIIFFAWLMVQTVNKIIDLLDYKRYKNSIIFIIILLCIFGVTYKLLQGTGAYIYTYYKDLHYVREGTYCEDVQDLIRAYTETTSNSKSGKTTKMYVETAKLKFEVYNNIVREKDYQDFEMKFNETKRVKIRYLPNSNILLYIEPVTG